MIQAYITAIPNYTMTSNEEKLDQDKNKTNNLKLDRSRFGPNGLLQEYPEL